MIRHLNVILMITSVVVLVAVYVMKYQTEYMAAELAGIERGIDRQNGELSLLKADWAALNQPGHIQPIVDRHADILGLEPIKQEQYGAFEDLPMRPAAPDTAALDELFELLTSGIDPVAQLIEGN
jgi:hypothetical protein